MSGYKNILFQTLTTLLLIATPASVLASESAEVQKTSCKIYMQSGSKVTPVSSELFPAGTKVIGVPHSKSPRFFITQKNGKTYLIDQLCLKKESVAADTSASIVSVSPWQARLTYVSYQLPLQILDPVQGDFSVTTQTHGICLGAGYNHALNANWIAHGDSCVLIGKADARGVGSNASNTQTYQNDGVGVFGLRTTLGVQYIPKSDGVKVGFAIPTLFDSVSFDNAGGNVTVRRSALHLLGLLLNLEVARGKYSMLTEFGFLQKFTQSTWSLGLAYQL